MLTDILIESQKSLTSKTIKMIENAYKDKTRMKTLASNNDYETLSKA